MACFGSKLHSFVTASCKTSLCHLDYLLPSSEIRLVFCKQETKSPASQMPLTLLETSFLLFHTPLRCLDHDPRQGDVGEPRVQPGLVLVSCCEASASCAVPPLSCPSSWVSPGNVGWFRSFLDWRQHITPPSAIDFHTCPKTIHLGRSQTKWEVPLFFQRTKGEATWKLNSIGPHSSKPETQHLVCNVFPRIWHDG